MSIFHKAAKTAFKVAKRLELIHVATFKRVTDNGFDEPVVEETTAEVIKERFTMNDFRGLIFRDKIQPTDTKLYVLGRVVADIDTDDIFTLDGIDYTVFGCEIDAAKAMWVVGVR